MYIKEYFRNMNLNLSTNTIIDMKKYNGRVNIMEEQDPDAKFKMYERIAIKNKATEYRNATLGIWEDNLLSRVYFSAENEQILQNGIRSGVYNLSNQKFVASQQSSDNLKIVMRSIFLQFSQNKSTDITRQIEVLNKMVLNYCVPFVYNEAVSYVKYLEDQSTLVLPLENSMQSDRQYKQLQERPWI
jgi:hypothetical protein